jgi:hypothetical protein
LAEKEGDIRIFPNRSCQLFDNTAQEHCLAFSGITSDPKKIAALIILPLFILLVV